MGNPVGYTFAQTMIRNRKYIGEYSWGKVTKLGGMLNSVYLFEGCIVATLNFKGARNNLAEVRIALDEADDEPEFVLDLFGWGTRIRT